jgi:hypothetical protein
VKTTKSEGRPLNLRGFPDDLYWLTKMCAGYRHMTLRAYVEAALRESTDRDSKEFMRKKPGENAD